MLKRRVQSHHVEKTVIGFMLMFGLVGIYFFYVLLKNNTYFIKEYFIILEVLIIMILMMLVQTFILIKIYERQI